MPIKWKKKFRPELILQRIAQTRTRNPEGKGASFAGFEIKYSLPSLHTMLDFPEVAKNMDHATLIWRAAAYDPGALTKESFLKELNKQLAESLSIREERYSVLTAISLHGGLPLGRLVIEGVEIKFYKNSYPKKFNIHRKMQLEQKRVPVTESPPAYVKVVASLKAKTPALAFSGAIRVIDLYRALWCLYCNSEMELMGRNWQPINAIRLGAVHTVHSSTGATPKDEFWFEPYHTPIDALRPNNFEIILGKVRRDFRLLRQHPYRDDILTSLLLFVRALDEWNQTTAFIRLWSALERLASPGHGDYDAVVRRCSFLWDDVGFATQTLEHLREYRNGFMHAGIESEHAKTYCFQLQQQFRALLRFHIGSGNRFKCLNDANEFLSLPSDLSSLRRLNEAVTYARRYRSPPERKE